MGKKNSGVIRHLYLIGMALTALGFCCPVFSVFGKSVNGFNLVTDNLTTVSVGVLLIFIGAVAGIVLCFVKVKNIRILKLAAVAVSILGGIILVIYMNDNAVSKFLGKQFLSNASAGFFMIVAGWIVALAGYFKSK